VNELNVGHSRAGMVCNFLLEQLYSSDLTKINIKVERFFLVRGLESELHHFKIISNPNILFQNYTYMFDHKYSLAKTLQILIKQKHIKKFYILSLIYSTE